MAGAAAQELRRRILEGEYREGSQLRQDALSKAFGMSRIPIREALVQLEAEGLVKIVPHRGAVVAELSLGEIDELYELRELLEPRLLRVSAPRLTESDYARLEEIQAQYVQAFRVHNVSRWGELNTALHTLLYQHAGQPRTLAIVKQLLNNAERYTRMYLAFTDELGRAEEDHAGMIELCRKGAIDRASKLLVKHIHNAGTALVVYIKQRSHR